MDGPTQTHFAHPGNRFYPALLRAGIITEPVDAARGMAEADRAAFLSRGLGITNLAERATARADELSPADLREGAARLRDTVRRVRPAVVAVKDGVSRLIIRRETEDDLFARETE